MPPATIAERATPGARLAPFLPSPPPMVDLMLEVAGTGRGDCVYDLGSGDGQVVLAAAQRFGARATGIEIDDNLAAVSSARLIASGVAERARIVHGDFLHADLRPATVVILYQLPFVNQLLRPILESQLRRGARVVTLDFPVPGWTATRIVTRVLPDGSQHAVYLYLIDEELEVPVATAYTSGHFAIEVGGTSGPVTSVEGGTASSVVIAEKAGPDGIVHKHLAGVKYDDIVITCGPGMSSAFYAWIADTLNRNIGRKDGAIVVGDFNFREISRLNFANALISRVVFPALDSTSKDAAAITVALSPDYTRQVPAGGSLQGPTGTKQKQWMRDAFRLNIDGLNCTHVGSIAAIVVQRNAVDESIRETQSQPQSLDISDLVITLPEANADSFYAWFDDFVIKGNNLAAAEKSGTLELLTSDQKETLFTLTFGALGIHRVSPSKLEAGSSTVRQVEVAMYCEQITFTYGPAAVSETAATASAQPPATATASSLAGLVEEKNAAAAQLAALSPLRAPAAQLPVAPASGLRFRT
jgi:hypothetical protein